jgi:hypothetical protein
MPRPAGTLVAEVRREMSGRGFALVDAPPFCDDGPIRALRKDRLVLASHDNRWWKYPELARYACWLERLLGRALPEEGVALVALEFRHEEAGAVDEEVDRLHADGSYVRSVCTLHGPSTLYLDDRVERAVPHGQTLLMTAMERARAVGRPCTLHRRPGAGPERAVIVGSFEPPREHTQSARVYRQAAHGDGRRRGS